LGLYINLYIYKVRTCTRPRKEYNRINKILNGRIIIKVIFIIVPCIIITRFIFNLSLLLLKLLLSFILILLLVLPVIILLLIVKTGADEPFFEGKVFIIILTKELKLLLPRVLIKSNIKIRNILY